jgi:S1-C subfamily serine protease
MLKIGPVEVNNIIVSLNTQSKGAFAGSEYSGNIGSGILKRFIVTFDYENQIMYLKPAPMTVADTGVFDRSGMWINKGKDGFRIVDITADGPAALAGLKIDDIIVSVDGRAAKSLPLSDLRRRLRNDPAGTQVLLGLQNGSTVTLVLRDQI